MIMKTHIIWAVLPYILHFLLFNSLIPRISCVVQDKEFWYEQAQSAIKKRLHASKRDYYPQARNVILVVGDGMSISTITAARILRGQRQGKYGEEHQLVWDMFPSVALAKTYNADAQVGESSACATALLCGVKANSETIGLDSGAKSGDCYSSFSSRVSSLIDWAHQEGKATGIVTTTRITHATPAALFAHSPSRHWEDDGKMPVASRKSCKDIARQLVEDEPGRAINVLLGGGRRHWLPKLSRDPEEAKEEGRRMDGKNLIDDWLRDKKRRGIRAEYVWNRQQMEKVNTMNVEHLLGLFAYSHMDFETDRNTSPEGDPSIAEMTRTALQILLKNPRGFFLFIEGGRIDHANHYNNAFRALDETLALEDALITALSMINPAETLIVVTSDHSNVMSFGGVSTPRGNPILGIGIDSTVSDIDDLPYSTLLYGNGPGYAEPRRVPSNYTGDPAEKNIVHGSAVPHQWATHGGEDVPVYSKGPLSTILLTGSVDQTYIPHAIAYAACLGDYSSRCDRDSENITFPENCETPEMRGVSTHDEVVANPVMADESRIKSHSTGKSIKCSKICIVDSVFISLLVLFSV